MLLKKTSNPNFSHVSQIRLCETAVDQLFLKRTQVHPLILILIQYLGVSQQNVISQTVITQPSAQLIALLSWKVKLKHSQTIL